MAAPIITLQCYGSDLIKRIREHDRKKNYKISLLSGNPITSTLTSPLRLTVEDVDGCDLTPEMKNSMIIECNKKTLDVIESTSTEYLMIDLMNETADRYVLTSGTVKAEFTDPKNAEFEKIIKNLYPDWKLEKRKCYEISDVSIRNIFSAICTYLKKRFDPKKIIIVECYYAEQYLSNDMIYTRYPDIDNIRKTNEFLKKCYAVIKEMLPGCCFVKFPEWTFGEPNTVEGLNPMVLDETYYKYVSKAIDISTGLVTSYSLENNFNRQTIDNRLKCRSVNSTMVWTLNEKIKKLEKELDEMKKLLDMQ